MRAILISAGKGTRLLPLTEQVPKNLLAIVPGYTLLDLQIMSLRACGITDIVIITGYKADLIEAHVQRYTDITTVYNPDFATADNLVSLACAYEQFNQECLTINGDSLFLPETIQLLQDSEHEVALLVDTKDVYDDDDMKVRITNGNVHSIGKKLQQYDAESVGIFKFSRDAAVVYRDVLNVMAQSKDFKTAYYLQAIQELITRGLRVTPVFCRPDAWAELDVPHDMYAMKHLGQRLVESLAIPVG